MIIVNVLASVFIYIIEKITDGMVKMMVIMEIVSDGDITLG